MLTGASLTQHWSPHQSRYAEVNIVKYATLEKSGFWFQEVERAYVSRMGRAESDRPMIDPSPEPELFLGERR